MTAAQRDNEPLGTADALGFVGWSPEASDEADAYSVAAVCGGVASPDRITSPNQPKPAQRARPS